MLNNISWGSYGIALSISLCVYYGCFVWLNRKELFARRISVPQTILPETGDELFPQASALSREIEAFLEQVVYDRPSRNVIVLGIHQIIKKYPLLAGTTHESAISRLIAYSAKDKCAVHLHEEDLRQVWLV